MGTTTLPFGSVRVWPPMTDALGAVEADHVAPPSVDRLIRSWLPWKASSHSM